MCEKYRLRLSVAVTFDDDGCKEARQGGEASRSEKEIREGDQARRGGKEAYGSLAGRGGGNFQVYCTLLNSEM